MRLNSKLTSLAAAVSMGVAGLSAPTVASADMSASFAASNFYLWRGQHLTDGAGAISGSLDYSHASGAYAGVWTSSEASKSEYDVYAGFAGEAGGLGYDISFWAYEYPETGGAVSYSDLSEMIIGLSYEGASFTLYDGLQGGNSYYYYTFGYSIDQFSAVLGGWTYDNEDLEPGDADYASEYMHLDLSYAATDELTFTLSKIIDDDDETASNGIVDGDTDMLVNVTYSKSFDL